MGEFGPAGAETFSWECPDLFPLPVNGDDTAIKWVLVVSVESGGPSGLHGIQYFIGKCTKLQHFFRYISSLLHQKHQHFSNKESSGIS